MTHKWNKLFFLSVICLQPSVYLTNSIHQIVNASLSESSRLDFSLLVEDLRGVVLFCIDSNGQQFGINIERGHYNYIILNFNKRKKRFILKELCGCDPCFRVGFNITIEVGLIYVLCNNFKLSKFSTDYHKISGQYEGDSVEIHDIPLAIANKERKMSIRIGNIGYYTSVKNIPVYVDKYQMIACLNWFLMNGNPIEFVENGTKVQSKCRDCEICNGGSCQYNNLSAVSCDCSNVALDGIYCNESLKTYNAKGNNSYVIFSTVYEIHLKMSWKVSLKRANCLIEFCGVYENTTFRVQNTQIFMNLIYIGEVAKDGANFLNIKKSNVVTISKASTFGLKILLPLKNITRINIGFCETSNLAQTLEGQYDFRFYSTGFERIVSIENPVKTENSIQPFRILHMEVVVIIIIVFTFATIWLIIFQWKRKLHINKPDKTPTLTDLQVKVDENNLPGTCDVYSSFYYESMSGFFDNDKEDTDGYMPMQRLPDEDVAPIPPPRNYYDQA